MEEQEEESGDIVTAAFALLFTSSVYTVYCPRGGDGCTGGERKAGKLGTMCVTHTHTHTHTHTQTQTHTHSQAASTLDKIFVLGD